MADIEKVIKRNLRDPFYYLTRGKIYEAQGMTDKAKADYKYACDNGEKEACEVLKKLTEGDRFSHRRVNTNAGT